MTMGITSPTSTTGQILKNGSAVISFDANNNATFAGNVAPSVNPTMRNRIINGAMVIDQRNAGAAVTTPDVYTVDRWIQYQGGGGAISWQQSSTAPTGFDYSLSATVTTADTSLGTSDYYFFRQGIEGYNVADLNFGTANAKTITISFWVRSSLTGTFGGSLMNFNATRSYPFAYTISAANTWEQKSITIAGDTSGTWNKTNGSGLYVAFSLGLGTNYNGTAGAWAGAEYYSVTGATSVVGTNGATFYITGVQVEVGSVATPFEQRLYGQELQLCQRYFYKTFSSQTAVAENTAYQGGIGVPVAFAYSTSALRNFTIFPQPMRTTPTVSYFNSNISGSATSGTWTIYIVGTGWVNTSSMSNGEISDLYVQPNINKTGLTVGYAYLVSGFLTASAEL